MYFSLLYKSFCHIRSEHKRISKNKSILQQRDLQQCCKGSRDNISKRRLKWTDQGPPEHEAEVVPSSAIHMYSFMHIAMTFSSVYIFTDLILMGKILFINKKMSHCVTKPVRLPTAIISVASSTHRTKIFWWFLRSLLPANHLKKKIQYLYNANNRRRNITIHEHGQFCKYRGLYFVWF